jgi:preprotein translocase subunit SecA
MSEAAREEITSLIERLVEEYTPGDFVEDWDVEGLLARVQEIFIPSAAIAEIDPDRIDREELTDLLQTEAGSLYDQREQELGEELMRALERFLLLQIIDQRWREHLYDMDYLREGIHLRAAAQIEPLVAYKNEAFELFRDLMNSVWGDFARMIFHVQVTREDANGGAPPAPPRRVSPNASTPTGGAGRVSYSGGGQAQPSALAMAAAAGAGGAPAGYGTAGYPPGAAPDEAEMPVPHVEQRRVDRTEQIGRNDPCWCGSGKKYKKCHGA